MNIYGRKDRSRIADNQAHVCAAPDRPLRIVAVEPLTSGRTLQAFYSTVHDATSQQVLTTLRTASVRQQVLSTSLSGQGSQKLGSV